MRTQIKTDNLDVSLLHTFLAVVEHGSMGKTAAAVDRTQPAISAQILRLEKIVGQRLFARGRNGVKLTSHGELLVTYANRAVALSKETLLRLRGENVGRRVALGMSNDVALVGFGAVMKRFQSIHPELELRIVVTAPNNLDGLLKSGKLDMAIVDQNFMVEKPATTWHVPLEWAVSKELGIDQSRALPLVLFEGPCSWQEEMLRSLRTSGWECRVTFESASLDAILAAVQSGLGMTALPADTIRNYRLNRVLHMELPPPPKIQFGMFRSTVLSSEARTELEMALDSKFRASTEAMLWNGLNSDLPAAPVS